MGLSPGSAYQEPPLTPPPEKPPPPENPELPELLAEAAAEVAALLMEWEKS